MICDICGKDGVNLHQVTQSYGKGEKLLVIENIPLVSCPQCGESYLTAATLHEIEYIRLHYQQWAIKRPVSVVKFG